MFRSPRSTLPMYSGIRPKGYNLNVFGWLRRITGISTPIGGLSWTAHDEDLPVFEGEICITCDVPENESFTNFVGANVGRIVFLKLYVDCSVALERQKRWVDEQRLDLSAVASGRFSGVHLPFPNNVGELLSVTFHFLPEHVLSPSHGGTGIIRLETIGFFEISTTYHGGPSRVTHLKEIRGPLEVRARIMSKLIGAE